MFPQNKKVCILVCVAAFISMASHGQYKTNDSIQKRISEISNSTKLPLADKLTLLLQYRDQIKNIPYKSDSTEILLLRLIGYTYSDEGNYINAVNYFRQSINIIIANEGKSGVKSTDLIKSYFWLSKFYDAMNNGPEKRKAIDSCIYIADRLRSGPDISRVRALCDRLEYFYDIGEYKLCIDDAARCEKLAEEYANTTIIPMYKEKAIDLAKISLGWHVNALLNLKIYTEAEYLLAHKLEEYKKAGAKEYIGLTYSQLSEVQEDKGNYEKALIYLKRSFEIYRLAGDNFNCKQTMGKMGEIYFRNLNDGNKALVFYRNALEYKNKIKFYNQADSIESLSIFGKIANVYIQMGLFDSAFFYFQRALDQIRIGINETDILYSPPDKFISLKKISYLTNVIIDKGDAFRKKYETTKQLNALKESIRIYTVVDKLLARINIEQFDLETKLFWRKDSRRLYESAIQACYLANDAGEAFYFFERSRAVLLNIQLAQQNWPGNEEVSKLADIKRKITGLELLRKSLVENSKEDNTIHDSLLVLNQELYHQEQLIKIHFPLYYQNADTTVMSPTDVREKLLKDHQAVLEIFSGSNHVYSILVTTGNTLINRISKVDFDNSAKLYISYISNPKMLNNDFEGFKSMSHHLYQLIFQNNPIPKGRIMISPEGQYFPFESLVIDTSSKNPVYFLNDHAVSYTYSARYLLNDFVSDKTIPSGNLLGVAPVHYASKFGLATLSGSDLSLGNIASGVNGYLNLVGPNASRNNFLKDFAAYKIIQLYTHASDSSESKEPVIYFADSALYLSELIPEKKPVTRLIVLSACETGNGILNQGEGVFSFNRGFAALGVPSSVINLWSVDNISTYKLTELFYKYLADGLPIDVAMQKAKLEYLHDSEGEYKLPYYWAAAVMVGKTDAIFYKQNNTLGLITIIILLVGFLIWIVVKSWRKV